MRLEIERKAQIQNRDIGAGFVGQRSRDAKQRFCGAVRCGGNKAFGLVTGVESGSPAATTGATAVSDASLA